MKVKEHLKELMFIFLKSFIIIGILFFALIYFTQNIILMLLGYFNIQAVVLSPMEYWNIQISLCFYIALFFTIPYMLWQLIKFVKEALPEQNYNNILAVYLYMLSLFLAGTFFGGLIFTKVTLGFLSNIPNTINVLWSLESIYNYFFFSALIFGISAQVIILIPILIHFKVIKRDWLASKRKYLIIAIVILCAFITPTGDPFSLAMMGIPLYMFFETGMIISYFKNNDITLEGGEK